MEWGYLIGAILICAVALIFNNKIVYNEGYKAGARRVLQEWKATINEEDNNQ